jgi:hypothetical protein
MKTKTSELTGAALDWAVAKCLGVDYISFLNMHQCGHFHFSTDWAQGGPIIERESIDVLRDPNGTAGWGARVYISRRDVWCYGPTPLIAAMRCYVASKLGEEVEVPDELS